MGKYASLLESAPPAGGKYSRLLREEAALPPPPSPEEVGLQQREAVRQQTLQSMQSARPGVVSSPYGPLPSPEAIPQMIERSAEAPPIIGGPYRAAAGATEAFGPGRTPLQRLGGATRMAAGAMETALPLAAPAMVAGAVAAPAAFAAEMAGGAALGYGTRKGLEAAGAPPEVAEAGELVVGAALPVVGTARRLSRMLPSQQAPMQTLGGPRALLPPASARDIGVPLPTGPTEPRISMEVVPRESPPTLVPPSRQLPPATQQMPAARLPEARRPVAAEATGQIRQLSLDDVKARIPIVEQAIAKAPEGVERYALKKELQSLQAYLEPQQLQMPIPDQPVARQGELWTGRAQDIKPESRVYGAGPEDVPKGVAQGELRRAEEAAGRVLPKTPKTPREYQPTLEKQLESIGFEARPKATETKSAVAQLSPESAATAYPAMKRLANQADARDAKIAKLNTELQEIQASTTPNPKRIEAINKELRRLSATGPNPEESVGIKQGLRDIEAAVPTETLARLQASQRPPKLGSGSKRRAYGESMYASAKYAPSMKAGQVFSKPDSPLPPRRESLVSPEAGSAAEVFDTKALQQTSTWIDRFTSLAKMERMAGGVPTDSSVYRAARLFAGFYGKAENRLQKLQQILPKRSMAEVFTGRRGKAIDEIVEYAKLDRFDELAKRGVQRFEGGQDITAMRARRRAMEEANPNLPEISKALTDYSNSLLKEARDAGIISGETYNNFLARNEKYIPLERIMEVEDEVAKGMSSGLSVSRQNLYKEIGPGSTREVRDPIESIVDRTYRTIGLIERNKAARKLADLAGQPGFEKSVVKVSADAKLPASMDRVAVLKEGTPEYYAVPKPVADAMRGLNEEQLDIVTRTMAKSGKLLRATATTYNPFFFTANIVRDFYSAMYRSDVGFTPLDWFRGAYHHLKDTGIKRQYLEAGGGLSGHYQREHAQATARELTRPGAAEAALTITNPLKMMRKIGELAETGTRLGVFNRAIKKGRSAEDAAFISRNASVDFARRGSVMRGLNMWVPFLNARTQGTVNVIEGARQNPGQAALTAVGAVMMPAAYVYYHNTRFFPETWDKIQPHEKENYFITIYGNGTDSDGNPNEVVKIPKGEIGRMFGNPLQETLAYLDGYDSKGALQMAGEILGDLSPVGFPTDTRSLGQTLSGITPPAPRAVLEIAANRNLYTGVPLESQAMQQAEAPYRYEENPDSYYYAAPWVRQMGKTFNVSPMKIKHVVEAQFGGLGRIAVNPEKSKTAFWSRFTKARGGAEERTQREGKQETSERVATERRLPGIKGRLVYSKIKDMDPNSQQAQELIAKEAWSAAQEIVKELGGQATQENHVGAYYAILEETGKEFEKRRGDLNSYEQDLKNDPVEVRARIFLDKIVDMQPEQRGQLQQQWEEKGIMTDDVLQRVEELWAPYGAAGQ